MDMIFGMEYACKWRRNLDHFSRIAIRQTGFWPQFDAFGGSPQDGILTLCKPIIVQEVDMYRRTALIALLGVMASALPAHSALFEGNMVRMSHDYPTQGTVLVGPQDALVGPGNEGTFFQQYYTIDVSDLTIDVAFTGVATFDSSAFNGVHVSDINGTIPGIQSVSLGATSFGSFDGSRISFDADNIYIDLRGINSVGGEFIQVNVLAAPVPEPAPYATMILGLIGVSAAAMTRRRERRTQLN